MRTISMTQPWAQALFLGLKRFETRSWGTSYRGPLLIHAAKGFPAYARNFASTELALGRGSRRMVRGAILGKVDLVNIFRTEDVEQEITAIERLYGDFTPGRYAWETTNPILLPEPIPYKGQQRFFNVPEDILPWK